MNVLCTVLAAIFYLVRFMAMDALSFLPVCLGTASNYRSHVLQAFKFFPKDRKMALVQLANSEEAVAALVKLHNYQLSETSHLRYRYRIGTARICVLLSYWTHPP
jgi:hypothetical protein